MRRLGVILATVGGAGYFPIAPGTVGSAIALPIYLLTSSWSVGAQATLLAVITLVGVWASTEAARHFNREDPGHVANAVQLDHRSVLRSASTVNAR